MTLARIIRGVAMDHNGAPIRFHAPWWVWNLFGDKLFLLERPKAEEREGDRGLVDRRRTWPLNANARKILRFAESHIETARSAEFGSKATFLSG